MSNKRRSAFNLQHSSIRQMWLFFLPVLLLLPGIAAFPYTSPYATSSDLTVTHYPNAIFLIRSLQEWHTIPLWSPTIFSGYPFFANPLSGLWYPLGWLALLFPLPLGFNLVVAVHLVWGGVGMYLLLRQEGLGYTEATFGGLAFEFLPKLFAHYGAGHLTLLYAVPWTPWLLWATLQNNERRDGIARGKRFDLLPGIILGLIFLADVRWAAYAGILWWGYTFAHSHLIPYQKTLGELLRQSALAFLLAAPLALPLTEYLNLSTRAALQVEDNLVFSLPPARLLGLMFPNFGGAHEYEFYSGGIVLVLAACAIFWRGGVRSGKYWTLILILSLLFALGAIIPGFSALTRLPGLSLLRVPARTLFLTGMSMAALGAYGLNRLLQLGKATEAKSIKLILVGLVCLIGFFTLGVWLVLGALPNNLLWGIGSLFVVVAWVGLRTRTWLPENGWILGIFVLGLIDWGVVDYLSYSPRQPEVVYSEGKAAAEYLASQPGRSRVYSPSYSLPQQTAARYSLELVDGVDPLQLEYYADFMEKASGVPRNGYGVTIPSFETGNPQRDNADFSPDPKSLGWLNAGFVTAEFDLPVGGLELVNQIGETRIYVNNNQMPRAWLQPDEIQMGDRIQPAEIVSWTPNRIEVISEGPGRLILSEITYPGWQVWVDGQRKEIQISGGLLRSIDIDSGKHAVTFIFRPISLYVGITFFIISIFVVVVCTLRGGHKSL